MGICAAGVQRRARRSIGGAALVAVLLCARQLPADPSSAGDLRPVPTAEESTERQADDGLASGLLNCGRFFEITGQDPVCGWTIDYRFRSIANGHTSYEFGMPGGWTPLSRLHFDLDSNWHGFQIGRQREDWGIHLEYMVPMQRGVQGYLNDYDWMIPGADFTDLGVTRERWTEGNMLDFGGEYLLFQNLFEFPTDLWATCGFRWQQYNLMCYDGVQYKYDNVWLPNPFRYPGNVIAFDQQYYLYYIGGQLRSSVSMGPLPPVRLTLQGDWAYTDGRNVDHHLIREGDRYTIEQTHGDTWHLGLTAEAPVRRWLTVGCQVDYQQTRTEGHHRLLNVPMGEDYTWTNGVRAWSDQTWLTAFVRVTW
jgi:hypothetical protein